MSKFVFSEVFPTKLSAIVFVAYMGLFVNQGVLVTASKEENSKYAYNTVTVVMMIEFIKLFASCCIFLKENTVVKLFQDIANNAKVLLLYFVPAFLYTLYNNLTFINLSVFDPTTYYLLLQLRVVVTGIVFQVLFKKQLSRKQWISLILLTVGCIVKQMNTTPSLSKNTDADGPSHAAYFYFFLVLVQVFCSCFAGVYNEFLLKDAGGDVHLMIQNVFMYLDSIVCNFVFIVIRGEGLAAFSKSSLNSVFQPLVIGIMLNGAACGIVTSVFLKNLNSILKTFASAIEISFTAICCWIIFGIAVDIYTFLSIAIVVSATYLYAQNPVVNKGRLDSLAGKTEDTVKLMNRENSVV